MTRGSRRERRTCFLYLGLVLYERERDTPPRSSCSSLEVGLRAMSAGYESCNPDHELAHLSTRCSVEHMHGADALELRDTQRLACVGRRP